MFLPALLSLQAVLFTGCADESSSVPLGPDSTPQAALSPVHDGAHGGNAHFYFLPPLAAQPEFEGAFDPTRSPVVDICLVNGVDGTNCGPTVAEFTMETGPGSQTVRLDAEEEHYVVNWHTNQFDLEDGGIYRIRVFVDGGEAGHVNVHVVANGRDLRNVDTDQAFALLHGRTLPIKFRIEAGFGLQEKVPAVAPDTVPDWVYERSTTNSPVISGEFLENIVLVIFAPGATQADRQAAVDAVGGTVVGGLRRPVGTEGYYYILVEDPYPDTPGQAVLEAMRLLNDLPQVDFAGPEFLFQDMGAYRRPMDSEGWRNWNLRLEDASGDKWGLERIAGPLAWGCSVGDGETNIAVVDRGFHAITDLAENLAGGFGIGVFSDTVDHGTSVASVLAARGDNGEGITGTMWEAELHLFEAGVDGSGNITWSPAGQPTIRSAQMTNRVELAGQVGARVINLSLGIPPNVFQNPGPSAPPSDSAIVKALSAQFYRAIQSLEAVGARPLIVIAAGNGDRAGQGIDAYWSGLATVRDSFPDRVLVVAASEQDRSGDRLAGFSNHNSPGGAGLVEIAAPGRAIGTLNGSGVPFDKAGTSLAAPMVSGVGGLLASFNPNLTSAEIKDLILQGAARGGRTAEDIPLLNAYESLKAAAERPGAPICGNRVWAAGGSLMVDRNGTSETLAPVGAAIGQLEVMHGGKFVNYLSPQGDQYLGWDAGSRTWRSATPPVNWLDELRSGTLLSMFGRSHDQDSASVVDISTVMGTDWFRTKDSEVAPVMAGAVDGPFQEVGRVTVHNLPSPLESNCLHRNPISGFCFFTLTETRGWLFRHSYPQFPTEHGREGYVTVSPMQVVALEFTEWTPCSFEPLHECRRQKSIQEQVEALVYRLDLTGRNATPNLITTIPRETVYWIGQAESSQDAVLGRGRWRMTHWADAGRFYATGDPFFDFQEELERCVIEYRREEDFGAVGSPIPADGACYWDSFNFPTSSSGTGTIAPSSVLDPSGWEVMEVDGRIEVRLPVVKPAFR